MIQRIQTVYLFIVALISGLALYFVPPAPDLPDSLTIPYKDYYVDYAFLASALLALTGIFLFKNRKRQMTVVRADILLNIILLGFFAYWFLNMPGELFGSEKGIGFLGPVISIVFLSMAHKAIKKDEKLVKSVDRLR